MAVGILRSLLPKEIAGQTFVVSAGTGARDGDLATQLAVQSCAEQGIDITSHRSAALTAARLRESDLVLGMEPHHLEWARKLAPDAAARLHLITERGAAPQDSTPGVWDPIGGTADQYRDTFNRIRSHLLEWVPWIQDEVQRREGVR